MFQAPFFPGEQYLAEELPNYAWERHFLVVSSLGSGVLFFFVLPFYLSTKSADGKRRELSVVYEIGLTMMGLYWMGYFVMKSSNNQAMARTVLEAPLLTNQECDHLIQMAHRIAARNTGVISNDTLLQQPPEGWRKTRHVAYPTTDLNLITDPFTKKDRMYIEHIMNRRLSPLYERIWGIHPKAVRANDMFIVRYDASQGQPFLNRHTDSSHISFNVLLNEEFEGGGTRFHHRLRIDEDSYRDVHPTHRGNVILNPAIMEHEGLPTTNGTRYIFVGFTSVDPYDPFDKNRSSNHLSLFASWLCLNWMQVRFGDAYETLVSPSTKKLSWANNKFVRSLFSDIHMQFTIFGDWWAPHRVLRLVKNENRSDYLRAMDDYYNANHRQQEEGDDTEGTVSPQGANWFAGQQVLMDLDGSVDNVWQSRRDHQDAFRDL